jgi:hypothetical protein
LAGGHPKKRSSLKVAKKVFTEEDERKRAAGMTKPALIIRYRQSNDPEL